MARYALKAGIISMLLVLGGLSVSSCASYGERELERYNNERREIKPLSSNSSLSHAQAQAQADSMALEQDDADIIDAAAAHRSLDDFQPIIRMQQGSVLPIELEDNSAAQDLLNRLPLRLFVTYMDNGTRAFFTMQPQLDVSDVDVGSDAKAGTIAFDMAWDHVRFFLTDDVYSHSLIKVGTLSKKGVDTLMQYKPQAILIDVEPKKK